MDTVQLNVRVDAALATRLKAEAKKRHAKPGALVAQALEHFLANAGVTAAPLGTASNEWREPLAKLAKRVEALEAMGAPAAPPSPSAPPSTAPSKPVAASGAITTAELATTTGTNRAAWNNWASGDRIGKVRSHPTAGDWKLVGKASGDAGGPARWLWELA